MQHMLKHLILPCVFTSKIKVALFYMVFALHLNVAWKWGTLTVSMFVCFFLSCMCFHCIFPIETHVWWIFHGISHMDSRYCFCFDICAHDDDFFVVIYDMINDIVNDHLQRSINNVISIPRKIIHPTPPHPPPHPALSRSMIQRDHLQRSINNVINIPRTIMHPTPPPTPPCLGAWYNVIICSGATNGVRSSENLGPRGYIYIHVCVHVYIYKCIYIHIYMCVYIYIYIYLFIYVYIYVCDCIYYIYWIGLRSLCAKNNWASFVLR